MRFAGSSTPSLVRESFGLIHTLEPEFARQFYETLFRRYPQTRALFRSKSLTTQAKMMDEALAAVLEHLCDEFWMEEALGGLGAQHVSYGVTVGAVDPRGQSPGKDGVELATQSS